MLISNPGAHSCVLLALFIQSLAQSLCLVQCVMPRCVLAGPSGVPSTRTNRGGQSGSSSLGRPREFTPSPQP